MYGEKNYPVRRGPNDLDIDLPDGTGDEAYLAELHAILPGLLQRVAPDLVFYIAGIDPHVSDRLGRLTLSNEGPAPSRFSLRKRNPWRARMFNPRWEKAMPRGDKSKYTDKQERKADHVAEGYEKRGVSDKEAERRAWATVNKDDGGGKKAGGSDRGKSTAHPVAHKGGRKGGEASASRSKADRSAAAKKGWETRRKKSG